MRISCCTFFTEVDEAFIKSYIERLKSTLPDHIAEDLKNKGEAALVSKMPDSKVRVVTTYRIIREETGAPRAA